MGRLSGHQAQVMALAVDSDIGQEGHDLVVSGSKDHYIKVSTLQHPWAPLGHGSVGIDC